MFLIRIAGTLNSSVQKDILEKAHYYLVIYLCLKQQWYGIVRNRRHVMGKDEITVTTIRLAKEIISNDTVIIGIKASHQKQTNRIFTLISYLNCFIYFKGKAS